MSAGVPPEKKDIIDGMVGEKIFINIANTTDDKRVMAISQILYCQINNIIFGIYLGYT